ncbi:tetratricopeptide repeat-containing sensor histidine kinase [Sphingobacterium micropteri]|uniref:tetratricopeptide repeat-containing sensor histidine kinase n=1 Tax=Sphingobacterium micropteri TaxID=2763501 RepID=UPI00293BBFE9|nr:tetratricopeptide repeat protein [Sphingobacterium micropteri]
MKSLPIYIAAFVFVACSEDDKNHRVVVQNPDIDKAYEYLERGVDDSAFFAFSKAKDIYIEADDSLNVANCLINMAITQKDQGDYFGAQETALQATDYLDESNPEHYIYLSTNYNNLGAATVKLSDFGQALTFYELALQFSNDSLNTLVYQNNIAICYQQLKKYDKALQIYVRVHEEIKSSQIEYARVLSNLARTKWLADPAYSAIDEFLTSLAIREQENDLWGLNASYVHLTDYYADTRPDSALWYAKKMYDTAKKIQSADDQVYALSKLIELSPETESKEYFQTYQSLTDSLHQARAAAKNQFALIRYEVEKNKADNLRLQKDNAEKINRLTRQRFFIGSLVFLLILFVAGGRFWYKKRKQRLELEAQHKIKASQLKTSRKVHDVVANGIYRVMSEIENKEDIDREGILDKLEGVYHKSRDISYEAEDSLPAEQSYAQQITELLTSFATAHQKVLIVGNESQLWDHVNENVKAEIKHMLQELMVNMRKHSHTDQVVIRFGKNEGKLKIFYKDNGVGMKNVHAQGNGLKNTGSRIKNLDGEIIFVSETGNGLKVEIAIPIS